jgi:hypothetical protein
MAGKLQRASGGQVSIVDLRTAAAARIDKVKVKREAKEDKNSRKIGENMGF